MRLHSHVWWILLIFVFNFESFVLNSHFIRKQMLEQMQTDNGFMPKCQNAYCWQSFFCNFLFCCRISGSYAWIIAVCQHTHTHTLCIMSTFKMTGANSISESISEFGFQSVKVNVCRGNNKQSIERKENNNNKKTPSKYT